MTLQSRKTEAMRCQRCKRFISPDTCLEGHDGTWFGSHPGAEDGYTGVFYCATGVGCNAYDERFDPVLDDFLVNVAAR